MRKVFFFSFNETEKKNENSIGVGVVCFLTILIGITLTLWCNSFLYTYIFYQIIAAISQNFFATLLIPTGIFITYILFELFVTIVLTKKIVKEFKLNLNNTLTLSLLLTSTAILYATTSMVIGAILSHLAIICPKPNQFPTFLIVPISICLHLAILVFGAVKFLQFSRRKIKIELGLKDDVSSKRMNSLSHIYLISLFVVVCGGNEFSADALIQSSSKALSEEYKRLLDAKKDPVLITTNYCVAKDSNITCSVTLIPRHYQEYTLYSNWEARVEKGKEKNGNIPLIVAVHWQPNVTQNSVIPTLHLESNKLMDLELTANKIDACKLEKMSASGETAIFFQVPGRSDEFNLPRPHSVRMRPNNETVFKALLKALCRPSDIEIDEISQFP